MIIGKVASKEVEVFGGLTIIFDMERSNHASSDMLCSPTLQGEVTSGTGNNVCSLHLSGKTVEST